MIAWEETERPKPVAFLSHSHEDAAMARRLVDDLALAHLRVWLDIIDMPDYLRHFRLDENLAHLQTELSWGIYRARAVLILLSPSAVRSKWIDLELRIAKYNDAELIPLLLEPCEVPLGYSPENPSGASCLRVPIPDGVSFRGPDLVAQRERTDGWGRVAHTIMMSRLVSPKRAFRLGWWMRPGGRVGSLHIEPGFEKGYFDFTDPTGYADSILALASFLVHL